MEYFFGENVSTFCVPVASIFVNFM